MMMSTCAACGQAYDSSSVHVCNGTQFQTIFSPEQFANVFQPVPMALMGCVCPPGANKDCENPMCPRRNPAAALSQHGPAGSYG